jgi:xylose isomerase
MRTYLGLRERAKAFRADPRVIDAMKVARLDQLAVPTLAQGESWRDLTDPSFDLESAALRGSGYELLDQLAIEHLMGFSG